MLKIKIFTFNSFSENTFVIWDDDTKETAVIDPGTSSAEEEKILSNFISNEKLFVKFLINTHCHIDHILGCKYVKENFKPVYLAPEKDLPLLEHAQQQASMFNISLEEPPMPDEFITEQLELFLGKIKMNFLFTPGHTPGEFCIYFEEGKICIVGDVLFKESIGRTDLWGGDYYTLLKSIDAKLLKLPDNVVIYHGDSSTIGYEKQNNPFLV